MSWPDEGPRRLEEREHEVAYVVETEGKRLERGSSRRRPRPQAASKGLRERFFVGLLDGAEKREWILLRQRLFTKTWAQMDERIQAILRASNATTLQRVSEFAAAAEAECGGQIPAAFVVTGPNVASQSLLFGQLSEALLQASRSSFVSVKASEATTLKAVLKKIICDATADPRGQRQPVSAAAAAAAEEEEEEEANGDGRGTQPDAADRASESWSRAQGRRRYLNYDLARLEAFLRQNQREHVFVALQDSEGFDSGLLSDLISLLHSWRPRIPFQLLFGIATSVELLQIRLLTPVCGLVYGAKFDCIQSKAMLERIFKEAVAGGDVPLRLGGSLLRSMLQRQQDQLAGIQALISSLKYGYMCHFYGNPLSILMCEQGEMDLQPEHLEAIRNLPSFRREVEGAVEVGDGASLQHASRLIRDDGYLQGKAWESGRVRQRWTRALLRALLIQEATGALGEPSFSRAYVECMVQEREQMREWVEGVKDEVERMRAKKAMLMLRRVIDLLREGEASVRLEGGREQDEGELQEALERRLHEVEKLEARAERQGVEMRSRWEVQQGVMRTTVVGQRVQLSRESAEAGEEEAAFGLLMGEVSDLLAKAVAQGLGGGGGGGAGVFLSESWLYEAKSPWREVFVPRPRTVFARSLGRPHDYLGCGCCRGGGLGATQPATCVLYQLYLETAGSLINVADLWTAFRSVVEGGWWGRRRRGRRKRKGRMGGRGDEAGDDAKSEVEEVDVVEEGEGEGEGRGMKRKRKRDEDEDEDEEEEDEGDGEDKESRGAKRKRDEDETLALFYRGLAELRALGFVKASKRKRDHVAKVKWL